MARASQGLTDDDVARLRLACCGPRAPRVRLLGTQFGDDVVGHVLAVGDRVADGDEFITVRVKVGSATDTLQMGPSELTLATRKRADREPATPVVKARRVTPPTQKPSAPTVSGDRPVPKVTPAARRRSPAPVTITVRSTGDQWAVSATRGGKSVVKAAAISPGTVTALADLIDQPALRDAVAEINEMSLRQAKSRAEELRAELAAVECLLKAHERPGGGRRG